MKCRDGQPREAGTGRAQQPVAGRRDVGELLFSHAPYAVTFSIHDRAAHAAAVPETRLISSLACFAVSIRPAARCGSVSINLEASTSLRSHTSASR